MTDANFSAGHFLVQAMAGILLAAVMLAATVAVYQWSVAFISLDWFLGAPYPREKYLFARLFWFACIAALCASIPGVFVARRVKFPDAGGVLAGSAFAGMLFALLSYFSGFNALPQWFLFAQCGVIVLQLPFAVTSRRWLVRRKSRAA